MSLPTRSASERRAGWTLLGADVRPVFGHGCVAQLKVTDGHRVLDLVGEGSGVASAIASALGGGETRVVDLSVEPDHPNLTATVAIDGGAGIRVGRSSGSDLVTAIAAALISAFNQG